MYTRNVTEKSIYFTDSMFFFYHNASYYKIPNYNIEFHCFTVHFNSLNLMHQVRHFYIQ